MPSQDGGTNRRLPHCLAVPGRLRNPPMGLIAAMLALACGFLLWLSTAHEFFYADDWQNFAQARDGLTWSWLRLGYSGTFAPGHRLLDLLVMKLSSADWNLARLVLLSFYAGAVAAFFALARALTASRRAALAATALFAASPVFGRLLQWYASGEHVIPAICFTLVALWAGVRFMQTRHAAWLPVAAFAQALGLAFYSKAILCPLYLVALRLLLPDVLPRAGRPIRALIRDWPLWAALGLASATYLLIVARGDYGTPPGHATFTLWSQFARVAWLRGDAPALIGQNVPADTTALNELAVVVAQVVVGVLVTLSLMRSWRAWRAWAWLVVAAIPNAVIVGVGRLHVFGPSIGQDLRYVAELSFLWPLAILFAFGVQAPRRARGKGASVVLAAAARVATPAGATALATVYLASYAGTLHRLADAWPTERSRAYVDRVRSDTARLRAAGRRPAVIDGPVPFNVVAGVAAPFNTVSTVLPEIDPHVPVNRPGRPLVTIAPDGSLQPVALALRAQQRRGGSGCMRSAPQRIAWAPRRPEAGDDPLLVKLDVRPLSRPLAVPVFVDRGGGFPGAADRLLAIPAGGRSGIVDVGATAVAGLVVELPAHRQVCVRRVAVLAYRPRA